MVCCVKFSADGKFLATGCNRTAQIYDVKDGRKVWYVVFHFSRSEALDDVVIKAKDEKKEEFMMRSLRPGIR